MTHTLPLHRVATINIALADYVCGIFSSRIEAENEFLALLDDLSFTVVGSSANLLAGRCNVIYGVKNGHGENVSQRFVGEYLNIDGRTYANFKVEDFR